MADDEIIDETESDVADDAGDEESAAPPEPKPPAKAQAKAKPGAGKAAPAKPAADETVTVSARKYAKVLERMEALESADRERQDRQREQERRKTDDLAPKDWKKARDRIEAAHRTELESLSTERDKYRDRLAAHATETTISKSINEWNRKNPSRRVKDSAIPHLVKDLRHEFKAEWDDDAGDFVLVEPATNKLAGHVIHERLGTDDYALFLESPSHPGAGGRGGAARPGAAPAAGGGKAGNPYADRYRKAQEARETATSDYRPGVGLRIPSNGDYTATN